MNNLVSVVVPIYNVELYIKQCIESILAQTYKEIEIILIDDGSTDDSGHICDDYEKKFFQIKVIHKQNGGLGEARNTGIENASGKYIIFIDGDDFIANDHISNMIKGMKEYNVDACYGGYCQQIHKEYISIINPMQNRLLDKEGIIKEFIPRMCGKLDYHINDEVPMSVCMSIYKMDIINSNRLRFNSEKRLISEDFAFNLDYLECSRKIYISDSCGYYYRYNNNSLTKRYLADRLEKQKYFSKYVSTRVKKLGAYNESEQRIYSTFLSWVRNIVKSEQQQYNIIGFKSSLENIKKICNDEYVIYIINNYNEKNLTFFPKLLNKNIKNKRYKTIWILSYLKNKTLH